MQWTQWFVVALGISLGTPAVAETIYVSKTQRGVPHFTNAPVAAGSAVLIVPSANARVVRRSASHRERRATAFASVSTANVDALIRRASAAHQVEEALVRAVIDVESRFNPRARSPKGAMGLMQLMPGTADRFGVRDAYDPHQNIDAGTRYLRQLLLMFEGNRRLAVAAYNAGEAAVIRHGRRVPPYEETQDYVTRVLSLYRRYSTTTR